MESLLGLLYKRLPSHVQDVALSVYGWRARRLEYSEGFRRHVQLLARLEGAALADLRAYQNQELLDLLRYARATVPYYRERWPQEDGESRLASDVLAGLPYVTKEDVRRHGARFLSEAVPRRRRVGVSTSGTTGTPQRLYVDRRSREQNYAYLQRLIDAAGVRRNAWSAVFMGRILGTDEQLLRRPWRTDYSSRRVLFSSYHLSRDTIPLYASKLNDLQPEWIDAYPSALWSLAELARASGLALPRPKAILLSSETLGSSARAVIEEQFSCPVTDFYAGAEQSAFFFQCEQGAYHQHPAYGVVEYLPAGIDEHGEPLFEIVGTGFHNRAMPLVRYRTGDLVARLSEGSCPCGLEFPMVGRIAGRYYGLIITPDGRRIAGIGPALKNLPIRESQLVQYAADAVEFRVVPGDQEWSSHLEAQVITRLRERIGGKMDIRVAVVDQIPRGPNGKFHMTVNMVTGDGVSGERPPPANGTPVP